MPESNFPSSLDTDANSSLPKTISNTAALNNPNHAEMHGRSNDAIIEVETKLGTGSSSASTGAVLIGTGSGASAWDTTPTFVGDVTIPEGDLILGSTAVTSTAAELNILDGCTATVSELNIMDGVTATTSELNILDGCTATAAEINVVDGVTGGTVAASKAVVVDGNKDIASFRNVTLTGELDAATLDISGDVDIDGAADIAGDLVLSGGADGALQFTNAGENSIKIPDNQASALIIEEADNAYITFTTTNSSEAITVAKPITMSSTLTVTGNADLNGDLDVDGTTNLDAVDIDGQLTLADGSSSAPAIAFGSDPDLGFFRVAADNMGFAATLPVVTSFTTPRRGTDGSGNTLVLGQDGSSRRYKENIENFTKSDWENVYNLQAVKFNWKEEIDAQRTQAFGLIAEDVADQIPELGVYRIVDGEGDTPVVDSVNYEQLCVYLLEVVKDLNNRLETIEG